MTFFGRLELAQDLSSEWPRGSYWSPVSDEASGIAYELGCIQDFSNAVSHMESLTIFHWADYTMLCTPGIFAALLHSCPRLRDVEFMVDGDFLGVATNDIAISPVCLVFLCSR